MSAVVGEMEKPPGRRRSRQTSERSREELQWLGYRARWRTAMREPASGGWVVKLPAETRARKVGLAGWIARSDHLQMAKVELRSKEGYCGVAKEGPDGDPAEGAVTGPDAGGTD